MYATKSFETKTALCNAIANGERIGVSQNSPFGPPPKTDGDETISGPNDGYNRWYARVTLANGIIVKVDGRTPKAKPPKTAAKKPRLYSLFEKRDDGHWDRISGCAYPIGQARGIYQNRLLDGAMSGITRELRPVADDTVIANAPASN